jgi:L-malate glycosyltransferase
MCSQFEALGRVTVEYMKAGIPVVGANAGSTSMLLEGDKYGLLYEAGNYVQLSERIRQLVSKPELVNQLTTAARQFAEATFNEVEFINGITESLD